MATKTLWKDQEFAGIALKDVLTTSKYLPQLDVSFLKMNRSILVEGIQILAPRFSVHPFKDRRDFYVKLSTEYGSLGRCLSVFSEILPRVFTDEFARSFDVYQSQTPDEIKFGLTAYLDAVRKNGGIGDCKYYFAANKDNCTNPQKHETFCSFIYGIDLAEREYQYWGTAQRMREKYRKKITLSRKLIGDIPSKTQRVARESGFLADNLYIVKEVKPLEWSIRVERSLWPGWVWSVEPLVAKLLETDPLLVGVRDGRCYLIDKFDLTARENYAGMEFTV